MLRSSPDGVATVLAAIHIFLFLIYNLVTHPIDSGIQCPVLAHNNNLFVLVIFLSNSPCTLNLMRISATQTVPSTNPRFRPHTSFQSCHNDFEFSITSSSSSRASFRTTPPPPRSPTSSKRRPIVRICASPSCPTHRPSVPSLPWLSLVAASPAQKFIISFVTSSFPSLAGMFCRLLRCITVWVHIHRVQLVSYFRGSCARNCDTDCRHFCTVPLLRPPSPQVLRPQTELQDLPWLYVQHTP